MPGEEDYDAIREAFMETSRGRWFLTEYAKRNRNADTTLVLDAVARLEAGLATQKQDHRDRAGDAIAAVAALLAQTRGDVEALLAVKQAPADDSAALKGVRVLREMSWTLRESGNDARIPNLLEKQATAIEDGLKSAIGDDTRRDVLALFDRLANEVEALTREDAPSREEPATSRASAATTGAEQPAKAPPVSETVDTATVGAAVAERVIEETSIEESPIEYPPVGEIRVEDTAAFSEALLDVPDETETIAGNAELTWDDAPVEAVHVETAEAVSVSELAATAEVAPAPQPSVRLPDAIESPALVKPHQDQQSLGASLIENGIVSKPDAPRGDPLAPFKRMTQAERVAFFS